MYSFGTPDFVGDDDDLDLNPTLFPDGFSDGAFAPRTSAPWPVVPLPTYLALMPQPAPILSLSELEKRSQAQFISHLKLNPTNLDDLLPQILDSNIKYCKIILIFI